MTDEREGHERILDHREDWQFNRSKILDAMSEAAAQARKEALEVALKITAYYAPGNMANDAIRANIKPTTGWGEKKVGHLPPNQPVKDWRDVPVTFGDWIDVLGTSEHTDAIQALVEQHAKEKLRQ